MVLLGCEANIISPDGQIDLEHETGMVQDYVLAGLHWRTSIPTGEPDYTKWIINAMNHVLVDVVSHPVRGDFPVDVERVIHEAAKLERPVEFNLSPMSVGFPGVQRQLLLRDLQD